jgi:hypothetical protein
MSKIGEPKVRFLSLSSLQTSRGGFLLAESALFTLPWLLFAADEGGIPACHCFFFSLYVLCHRADLFFVLSPQLFSSSARSPAPAEPFHGLQRAPAALQQHPRPAPRSRREHGARAEDPSPSTVIPAAVLKQALHDTKGTSPRSTQPLPSSRRRTRSAPSPTRTSSKLERRAFSDGRHGTKRLPLHGDVPSAGGVSKCAAARPRLRQHLSPDLEERWSSRA